MKKKKIITKSEEYAFCTDKDDTNRILALTKENASKVIEMQMGLIPDDSTITVYELDKINEDKFLENYDLVDMRTFEFPVKRVHWEFLSLN